MSLKSDIEKNLGIPVKLKAGMPGSLDVYADGKRIYSKGSSGRLPEYRDIVPFIEKVKTI